MSKDVLKLFEEYLNKAGLLPETIFADGKLHRCGTIERPNRKDRAYKAFLDPPPTIWWMNWRTGEEGKWTDSKEKDLSFQERKALRERIEAAKAETRIEQEKRWKAAVRLAEIIWKNAKPADRNHPYLKRKQIPSIGVRQSVNNSLIVPIFDGLGKIQSLQFILAEKKPDEPGKLFLRGGRTS